MPQLVSRRGSPKNTVPRPLGWESRVSPPPALVLIASFSVHDGRELERLLERSAWSVCTARDAGEAARACADHDGATLLVIDSGLLESRSDPQWRIFQKGRPGLGVVVRCLIPRGEIRPVGKNTLCVRPDDEPGLLQALRLLAEMASAAA